MKTVIITLLAALVFAAQGTGDSPTFIINNQIGDIRLGESMAHVTYDYGYGRLIAPYSKPYGNSEYKYNAGGRRLRVFFNSTDHVLAVISYSSYYRTNTDIGVGTQIPWGKRWHSFKRSSAYGSTVWVAQLHGIMTTLWMRGNKVYSIEVAKGHLLDVCPC